MLKLEKDEGGWMAGWLDGSVLSYKISAKTKKKKQLEFCFMLLSRLIDKLLRYIFKIFGRKINDDKISENNHLPLKAAP